MGDTSSSSDAASTSNAESSVDSQSITETRQTKQCLKDVECLKEKGTSACLENKKCIKHSTSASAESSSDNGSNAKEKKKMEKSAVTESSSECSGTDTSQGTGWTLSQDCALRGMKEAGDGLSWSSIARTLGRSKNDVKARWAVIKDTTNTEKKKAHHNAPLSGEEASSELSSSDSDDDESTRQSNYLHASIIGDLYPSRLSIEPDECFRPRDCQVLAAAESRHNRSKWLEMQANFFNVTGRMVPLHLIRAKCERAEQQQATTASRRRVHQWIRQVEDEE